MSKKERIRLAQLVIKCEIALDSKDQQSMYVFRGDMRVIVAAYKQIQSERP